MTTKKRKIHNLGPAQERIIKHLAENGPRTANALASELDIDPAGVYRGFIKLEKKGLLTKKAVSEKEWRGRVFVRYWFTLQGVKEAVLLNADTDKIMAHAATIYKDDELTEIKNLCNLTMFDTSLLRAAMSLMNGGSVSFTDTLQEMVEKNAPLIPEYLEKSPEVAEVLAKIPILNAFMKYVIDTQSE